MSEKKLPPEIKAILEKDDVLTDAESKILEEYFKEYDDGRGAIEAQLRKEAEERYRKKHPPLPDPEWW